MTTIKTQIVIPEELLNELDKMIKKRERSDFVVEAVREKLQRLKLQQSFEKAAGIWKNHPELKTDSAVQKYLGNIRGADTRRTRSIKKAWHG